MSTTTLSRKDGPHHPHDPLQMLNIADLAALLRVTPATIHHWRKTGRGPVAHRLGKNLHWRHSDVEAWINAHRER